MMASIMQAGQVPASGGNVRDDLENLRRYLTGLTFQLEGILLEIEKRLEVLERDNHAAAAIQQQGAADNAD